MAYVPPHLRNKKQSEPAQKSNSSRYEQPTRTTKPVVKPVVNVVEDNFPALGNGTQRSSWIGRKFADLATEWNEDDERRKEHAENVKAQRHDYTVVLPRFQNIRKFEEPEDREVEVSPSNDDSVDGWKTIERKKTQQKPKEKTFEEYDKEEEKKDQEDETVWDVPEYETCWDERY